MRLAIYAAVAGASLAMAFSATAGNAPRCEVMGNIAERTARRASIGFSNAQSLPVIADMEEHGGITHSEARQLRQMVKDIDRHPNISPGTAYDMAYQACGWRPFASYR